MNTLNETYKSRGLEPIPPWFTGRVEPGKAWRCVWWYQFEHLGAPRSASWQDTNDKYADKC